MDPVILADGISRSFPSGRALDSLSLQVNRGEVLALLGPNGAGKTTTVRILNGVLAPDSGEARVLGLNPLREGDELRRRTGVLTENAGLDDRLSARENLEFVARVRGFTKAAAGLKAAEALERFGLADRADFPVQGASTGQRKRLALARALIHDPEVLFLDEPTSGLDPAATREVMALISSLAQQDGRTVILCTHFLGEAGRLADRMAVLYKGQLQAIGRPQDLASEMWPGIPARIELSRPADARVLGIVRRVEGVLEARSTDEGIRIESTHHDVLSQVIAALLSAKIMVYAAIPDPYSLEDVYFAIEAQAIANETSPESEQPVKVSTAAHHDRQVGTT